MPRHIMICVSGFSGSGKDELLKPLVAAGAVQTGLADVEKRHLANVYGFTEKQLFGPSEFRNAGDMRYMKNFMRGLNARPCKPGDEGAGNEPTGLWTVELSDADDGPHAMIMKWVIQSDPKLPKVRMVRTGTFVFKEGDPRFWLSPREALQGSCEKLNDLWIDTWIRKGIEDQKKIASGKYLYSRMGGVLSSDQDWTEGMDQVVTCFADFRHIHEMKLARASSSDSMRVVTVRVKRPSVPTPPYMHRSELEQIMIRDAAFDFVVDNSTTVAALHARAARILEQVSAPGWTPKQWTNEYLLAVRRPEEGYAP